MSLLHVRSLDYRIVPGKPGEGFALRNLHDSAFHFWRDFWNSIYRANGSDAKVNQDEFTRQDFVSVLVDRNASRLAGKEEIAGLFTSTIFRLDFQAQKEHSYFTRAFSEKFFQKLAERGAKKVMTIEYYAVAPVWRSKQAGVSLGMIMAGLAVELAKARGIDALVCVARTDIGVDRFGKAFGAETLDGPVQLYNTPCDLLGFFRDKLHAHADPETQSQVNDLWARRTDHTLPGTGEDRKAA